MYRTRIFLIWALIVFIEAIVFFVLGWNNVYIPKRVKKAFDQVGCGDTKTGPLIWDDVILRSRSNSNYAILSFLVAFSDVLIFAVFHYGEILSGGFDGLWFGHLILLFSLFLCYVTVSVVLFLSLFFGEMRKEDKLMDELLKKITRKD